jgi:hypothetical protein
MVVAVGWQQVELDTTENRNRLPDLHTLGALGNFSQRSFS